MHLVCPVLVGRERELERAASLLRAAAGGAGTVVLVAGETGVGKTRLVNAVRELAEREGVAMAGGGCLEPFATQPYAPVAELLRDLLRERDATDARALVESVEPWLLRLLPELGGAAEDGAAVEEHERYRVARGVCSLLERCAAEQPLVVVLEDLHWSDAATLELLPWLARRVRDCAVLVLATLRSDELGARPDVLATVAELERQRLGERIALAPLEPDAVEEMVRAIAVDASPALLDAVRRRSDGNPLFVEELVRTLARRVRRGAADDPGGDRAPRRPPSRRRAGAVERRLGGRGAVRARAGAADRRARRRGGVGRRAGGAGAGARPRGAPGRLPVPPRADARRGVRAAARARAPASCTGAWPRRSPRRPASARPRWRSTTRRRATPSGRVEFAERAAERAMALGALADARVHLRMALRVTWGAHERARLLAQTRQARARDRGHGRRRSPPVARRRRCTARRAMWPLAHTRSWTSRCRCCTARTAPAPWRSAARCSSCSSRSARAPSWHRRIACSAISSCSSPHYEEAARWSRRAIDLGRRLGADDVVQEATNDLGVAVCLAGDAESGLALLRSVLPATRGYVNYGSCLAHACRYEEAIAVSREGEAVCRRSGAGLRRRICQLNLAGCLRLTGAWEEAESVLVEILAEGEETGFRKHQLMGADGAGAAARRSGPLGRGAGAVRAARAVGARPRGAPVPGAAARDRGARARRPRRHGRSAVGQLESLRAHWRERTDDAVLIAPALALGCELGAPWADELARVAERSISPETGVLLQQVRGDHAGAAAAWERLGRPFDRARALRLAGGVERLEQARAIFARLGAAHELALTEAALRRAGIRIARGPRPSTRHAPGGLTARELEVARLLADGLTNAELAARW